MRGRLIAGVVAVAVMAVLGYSGGCASSTLPSALTPSQQALIQTTRFRATLVVERFQFPVYSEGLTKVLGATRLFDQVREEAGAHSEADLVARIERTIYGEAAIPCLTGISLGLIPMTVQEEHGYSFSLVSGSGPSGERVPVLFSYTGPSTLGWYCLFLNLSPDRTSGDVYAHRRFRDGLAWAVVEKRDLIYALLKKGGA